MVVFTKVLLAALLFLLTGIPLRGTVISGRVTDSLTHEALADVIVTVKGTNIAIFTDALGHYCIPEVQADEVVLRYFRLGYETKVVSAVAENETPVLNVSLSASAISLEEVTIAHPRNIGQSLAAISHVDKLLRPTNSAQDLLRLVPGLFTAQHAGGGKAEQIFLRGFDVDHGTDFAVSIDGMPVNIVSHAHGQGYADFHFVIPETVEGLNVSKGPYAARHGNFATSGAGEFSTKNAISRSQVKLEYGMFDTYRAAGLFNLSGNKKRFPGKNGNAYIAGEYYFSDSYFESSQHLNRYNVFGKYSGNIGRATAFSFSASTFSSAWDASGQVPTRAVQEGLITRFGSIDNTEGGTTSRTNANLIFTTPAANGTTFRNQVFYSRYAFDLYSNFTFFLHDSINGDGIRQIEKGRNIYGYTGTVERAGSIGNVPVRITAGIGTRIDRGEILLAHALRRTILDTIVAGQLYEQNIHAYVDETIRLSEKFSINTGMRFDHFIFSFDNSTDQNASGKKDKHRFSPKLNFQYDITATVQLYIRSGIGFHSNDTRAVISGIAGNSLPRAYGYEAGSTFKAGKNILLNVSLWGLDLENELVYVGDEGVVEISGATRRLGVDFSARWQITPALFADMDLNFSHGRFVDLPAGENYIPLAPRFTGTGGITYRKENGFSGSLRYRFMDSRPANETGTVTAQGFFLVDAVVNYRLKNIVFGLTAENLLNSEWNEAQFNTESRLRNEAQSVSELHFTPGTPFFVKGSVTCFF